MSHNIGSSQILAAILVCVVAITFYELRLVNKQAQSSRITTNNVEQHSFNVTDKWRLALDLQSFLTLSTSLVCLRAFPEHRLGWRIFCGISLFSMLFIVFVNF
jgi:hypothetical protein